MNPRMLLIAVYYYEQTLFGCGLDCYRLKAMLTPFTDIESVIRRILQEIKTNSS
jgi:hypothetical protein